MNMPLLAAALATLALPVWADEMWSSDLGDVIYERDAGDVAVFSFPMGGDRAEMYVENMLGNFDRRGTHTGYWINGGAGTCSATLTGPDGVRSNNWGRFTLHFDNRSAPTGFVAHFADCLNDPDPVWQLRTYPY